MTVSQSKFMDEGPTQRLSTILRSIEDRRRLRKSRPSRRLHERSERTESSFVGVLLSLFSLTTRVAYCLAAMLVACVLPTVEALLCLLAFVLDRIGDILETPEWSDTLFKFSVFCSEMAVVLFCAALSVWVLFVPVSFMAADIILRIISFLP